VLQHTKKKEIGYVGSFQKEGQIALDVLGKIIFDIIIDNLKTKKQTNRCPLKPTLLYFVHPQQVHFG
jgi:hypothetical protein